MQFIRLSALKSQFPDISFPVTPAETEVFRSHFYQWVSAKDMRIPETEQWLTMLQSDQVILFLSWTEQERNLAELLEGTGIPKPFQNVTRILEHALADQFRVFVTPFLQGRLSEALAICEPKQRPEVMSWLRLLTGREADLVQQVVYDRMMLEQTVAEERVRRAHNEDEILKVVREYLQPDRIATLNLFTPSFYGALTRHVALVKQVAMHPSGTRRLVVFMTQEMQHLQLQPEHRKELLELDRSVKSGMVKVESGMSRKKVVRIVAASVFFVGLIAFIWLLPSKPEPEQPQDQTAFMDFTVEERKTMDSLLQQAKERRENPNKDAIDQSDMTYVGQRIQVNIPWKNTDAQRLINQWLSVDTLQITPKSVDSRPDDRAFPGTEALTDKHGTITATFKNDTEISVMILVFRDKPDEWVYTEYVGKKEKTTIKLNPEDNLFVLPGSKVPVHLNTAGLPFAQLDSRFFRALKNGYTVDGLCPHSIKLVWTALNNYDFYLLDVNGGLNK